MGSIIAIALGIALIVGVVVFAVTKANKKSQTHCKKCKTPYELEGDIIYKVLGNVAVTRGTNAKVEFECKCHNCGEERKYIKEFPKQRIDGNDKVVNFDVDNEINEYFKK